MSLKKMSGKKLSKREFIELDTKAEIPYDKRWIDIKVDKLVDFADSNRIQRKIKEGTIVLVKIKELKDEDLLKLEKVTDKLRKTCVAMNGDIENIDENWLIAIPSFAHIVRES